MNYLSVCSGIEAATVAWHDLGWTPLAFSEIEAFPRAVLQHHYPHVPLHGDFTKLRDEPWIVDADILVGGTPCQAFSVAGLRQSLSDDRGNLSLEFIRLANAIDDLRRDAGREPAFVLWENVPGVLSTNDNAFGTFLAGLCGCDTALVSPNEYGWSDAGVVAGPKRVAAWRVLDAQYFGLAQRRRRVFVLARGGARGWACADALLPIVKGVSGNTAPRRKEGQGTTGTLAARTKGGGGLGTDFDCDGGLIARCVTARNQRLDAESETFVVAGHADNRHGLPTLRAEGGDVAGGSEALVASPQPFTLAVRGRNGNHELEYRQDGIANAVLTPNGGRAGIGVGAVAFMPARTFGADGGIDEHWAEREVCDALHTNSGNGNKAPAIAFNWNAQPDQMNFSAETVPTLSCSQGAATLLGWRVRRLTPGECEKLQGFFPGYTAIPYRGKPASDGPRYKSLGNSMATRCMKWIGMRIKTVCDVERAAA